MFLPNDLMGKYGKDWCHFAVHVGMASTLWIVGRPLPEEGEDHYENGELILTSCRNTNVAEQGSSPI